MKELFTTILNLFTSILTFFLNILKNIITIFEDLSKILETLTGRFSQKANNLDDSLDQKKEEIENKKKAKFIHKEIRLLFFTNNIVGNATVAKRLKLILIIGLQFVSFFTTFMGFNQCFSSIGLIVPLILAAVIQLSVIYLCGIVNSNYTRTSQRILLFIVISISIYFSYIGVTETLNPYQDYAEKKYNSFVSVYNAIVFESKSADVEDPNAKITGVYNNIESLLNSANLNYGESALIESENKLADYKSRTVGVEVKSPDSVYFQYDGTAVVVDGGTEIKQVPDENYAELIIKENENIENIKQVQLIVSVLNDLLMNECDLDSTISIVSNQMENSDVQTNDFISISSSVSMLTDNAKKLSELIKVDSNVSIDLIDLIENYRKMNVVQSLPELQSFNEIYTYWNQNSTVVSINLSEMKRENYNEEEEKETPSDAISESITTQFLNIGDLFSIKIQNPMELKNIIDNNVDNAYNLMINALEINKNEDNLRRVNEAYSQYQLMIPLTYAGYSLFHSNENQLTSLFCLLIALINDGLAWLIGRFFDIRNANWLKYNKITPSDVKPYIYSQFKSIIMPILLNYNGDNNSKECNYKKMDIEEIYKRFVKILTEYLNKFELAPNLFAEGYSRYYVGDLNNAEFNSFCSFLIQCGLAKFIYNDDIPKLNVLKEANDINESNRVILLTSKGELWLTEMIGNSVDVFIDYNS